MAKYDEIVEGYREKQGDLRRQIAKLKGQAKMGTADQRATMEAIQRIERQIADLEKPSRDAVRRGRLQAKRPSGFGVKRTPHLPV
jgi:predicted  nucleic acid-binding Zn-ribbon protein